jgi:hypothetical protein
LNLKGTWSKKGQAVSTLQWVSAIRWGNSDHAAKNAAFWLEAGQSETNLPDWPPGLKWTNSIEHLTSQIITVPEKPTGGKTEDDSTSWGYSTWSKLLILREG